MVWVQMTLLTLGEKKTTIEEEGELPEITEDSVNALSQEVLHS